jgi:hypothetical protein
VTDQDHGVDASAPVLGCRLVGDRRPQHVIVDAGRDALLLQPGGDLVHAE